MWHAERVPLSSAWWLKLLPSCRPEKHVDYGSQPASRRGVEGLINGDSDGGDTCRPLLNMPLHNVIWTRGSVFVEEKKKNHSLEFLKRGLRFFLWIIHCNLWNIIRSVCGCNWFVYENSHCSEKCQRQPNHRADSSGSHCSVNAASAAPPSKTKPRLKANSATTVHAGNHSSCCSHRLKAGWFSVISLQRTPELVKPLTVQLSWTIRHVSSSRSVWVDTWRRRFEAEEPDGWGKQIYRLQQTRQLSSATGQMWKLSFHQRVPPLGGFPSGSIINHGGETLSRKPHFNKERQKEARWK